MNDLEPLPQLEFDSRLHFNSNLGSPGELRWLPITQLYIDRKYQRHILRAGKANIRQMAEGFSWSKFGCLVVGQRAPEVFAIIDGQHRATAVQLRGDIPQLPCLVRQGGQISEAESFAALHVLTTRLHPLQAFRAAVVAGDNDSVRTVELCRQGDVTIVSYPKQDLKFGETQCLNNIRNLLRHHGPEFLISLFQFLRTLDPDAGITNNALMGTAKMLERHGDWLSQAEAVAAKLAKTGVKLAKLEKDAMARKLSYGSTAVMNFSHVIEQATLVATRVSSRFYSPEAQRQAMGSR